MKKKRKYYGEFIENKKINLRGYTSDINKKEYDRDLLKANLTIVFIVIGFISACFINYIWR